MEDLRYLIEDGAPTCPACVFCDERINGEMTLYGGTPMHKECYEKLGEEMAPLDEGPAIPQMTSTELDDAMEHAYGRG